MKNLFYTLLLLSLTTASVAWSHSNQNKGKATKSTKAKQSKMVALPKTPRFTDSCDGSIIWRKFQVEGNFISADGAWGGWVPDKNGKPIQCKVEKTK